MVYGPDGTKLALMNGQTLFRERVPMLGGGRAVYTSGTSGPTLLRYWHPNWQGSIPLGTNPNQTIFVDGAFAPYGEPYASTPIVDFTGQNNDTESEMYDFPFRRYHFIQGRWISPDPAGLGAVDPTNPQSWNRYAYVANNPLALIDPLGMDSDDPDDSGCIYGYDCPEPCLPNMITDNCDNGTDPVIGGGGTPTPPTSGGPSFGIPGALGWSENPGINIYQPLSPLQLPGLLLPGVQNQCEFGGCGGPVASGIVSDPRVVDNQFVIYVYVMELMELPLDLQALRQAGRMAGPWVNAVAVGTVAAVAAPPALAELATSGAGDFFFARGTGLLNSNNWLRIGWGWYGGNIVDGIPIGAEVFRIVVGSPSSPIHWHLWPF